jgi:hypothetical protein
VSLISSDTQLQILQTSAAVSPRFTAGGASWCSRAPQRGGTAARPGPGPRPQSTWWAAGRRGHHPRMMAPPPTARPCGRWTRSTRPALGAARRATRLWVRRRGLDESGRRQLGVRTRRLHLPYNYVHKLQIRECAGGGVGESKTVASAMQHLHGPAVRGQPRWLGSCGPGRGPSPRPNAAVAAMQRCTVWARLIGGCARRWVGRWGGSTSEKPEGCRQQTGFGGVPCCARRCPQECGGQEAGMEGAE